MALLRHAEVREWGPLTVTYQTLLVQPANGRTFMSTRPRPPGSRGSARAAALCRPCLHGDLDDVLEPAGVAQGLVGHGQALRDRTVEPRQLPGLRVGPDLAAVPGPGDRPLEPVFH